MPDLELTDVQAQARAWLIKRSDAILCPRHGNARTTIAGCAKRMTAIELGPTGRKAKLTDKQLRLRERWAGCEGCEHAEAATKLIEEMKMKEG